MGVEINIEGAIVSLAKLFKTGENTHLSGNHFIRYLLCIIFTTQKDMEPCGYLDWSYNFPTLRPGRRFVPEFQCTQPLVFCL
ncbi:hypothetical protein EYZ11_007907 [Aspergillus tanneri]|uniref:Uncharacterized protein n=1 Tax=Aspergillus tanneri TaxID=1220188 RepID=A0A4S3JC76_9EURO|nr:hypothetical protein EYZ11_007907 [Aspergillus tanneri]